MSAVKPCRPCAFGFPQDFTKLVGLNGQRAALEPVELGPERLDSSHQLQRMVLICENWLHKLHQHLVWFPPKTPRNWSQRLNGQKAALEPAELGPERLDSSHQLQQMASIWVNFG